MLLQKRVPPAGLKPGYATSARNTTDLHRSQQDANSLQGSGVLSSILVSNSFRGPPGFQNLEPPSRRDLGQYQIPQQAPTAAALSNSGPPGFEVLPPQFLTQLGGSRRPISKSEEMAINGLHQAASYREDPRQAQRIIHGEPQHSQRLPAWNENDARAAQGAHVASLQARDNVFGPGPPGFERPFDANSFKPYVNQAAEIPLRQSGGATTQTSLIYGTEPAIGARPKPTAQLPVQEELTRYGGSVRSGPYQHSHNPGYDSSSLSVGRNVIPSHGNTAIHTSQDSTRPQAYHNDAAWPQPNSKQNAHRHQGMHQAQHSRGGKDNMLHPGRQGHARGNSDFQKVSAHPSVDSQRQTAWQQDKEGRLGYMSPALPGHVSSHSTNHQQALQASVHREGQEQQLPDPLLPQQAGAQPSLLHQLQASRQALQPWTVGFDGYASSVPLLFYVGACLWTSA